MDVYEKATQISRWLLGVITLRELLVTISDQTVGNILKRHGVPPAPERQKTTTWKAFIRTHLDMLVATDFFTAEVWTLSGLVTYYVLFFIETLRETTLFKAWRDRRLPRIEAIPS